MEIRCIKGKCGPKVKKKIRVKGVLKVMIDCQYSDTTIIKIV